MRYLTLFALLLATALGGEMEQESHELEDDSALYESGEVHMSIMKAKELAWGWRRASGRFDSSRYPTLTNYTRCVDGKAGEFRCKNVDLAYFASHKALGSSEGQGSSSWGWTSPEGREIIIIAQADGAAFAEVLEDGTLEYLGRLPPAADSSIWREIRVLGDYAIIGSEAIGHFVQIFDMRKVAAIKPSEKPKTFSALIDLTGRFMGLPIGRTHNIVVNPDFGYAIAVGAQPRNSECKSGLIFIDMTNPAAPTTPGCAWQDGYVHDAQCLRYKGPDERFLGHDICYAFNEDTLTIYDVTNKTSSTVLSRTPYTGASFTHQGWLLDPEHQDYLFSNDELDEVLERQPATDRRPVTYIWDVKDLTRPRQTGYYKSSVVSIDHNHYVVGTKLYQSNYGAGLRILDVSSVRRDPTGSGITEVGFFDVYPEDDKEEGGGVIDYVGSWSSYAFFKSGWIVVNTIERGVFVVRYTGAS